MSTAGYSGTPLAKKLGMKPGMKAGFVNAPAHYPGLMGETFDALKIGKKGEADFIHFFATEARQVEKEIDDLRERIFPDGLIWVSWPKKAAKMDTDLTEDVVRNIALAHGLVDVKVCAVDEIWSGLKLVVRLKDHRSPQP